MTRKGPIETGLETLFGSVTRARTLAALASASSPLTGYRVSLLAATQPIKTYAELRKLRKLGIVTERTIGIGKVGWELADPDLRSLCRRRARISWSRDWSKDVEVRTKAAKIAVAALEVPTAKSYRGNADSVPNRAEFIRNPEKDRVLRQVRLAPSTRRPLAR